MLIYGRADCPGRRTFILLSPVELYSQIVVQVKGSTMNTDTPIDTSQARFVEPNHTRLRNEGVSLFFS